MARGNHSNHRRGSAHPRWNPDRIIDEQGYVKIRVGKDHPLADSKGFAYEHLVVWASAGNELPGPNELLHHKDEDKQNNRIGNLEKKLRAVHSAHHIKHRRRDAMGRLLPGLKASEVFGGIA